MSKQPGTETQQQVEARAVHWLEDPLGSIIAASAATIGSFGVVLGGIWAINVALH